MTHMKMLLKHSYMVLPQLLLLLLCWQNTVTRLSLYCRAALTLPLKLHMINIVRSFLWMLFNMNSHYLNLWRLQELTLLLYLAHLSFRPSFHLQWIISVMSTTLHMNYVFFHYIHHERLYTPDLWPSTSVTCSEQLSHTAADIIKPANCDPFLIASYFILTVPISTL